jgi:hypothetical protein
MGPPPPYSLRAAYDETQNNFMIFKGERPKNIHIPEFLNNLEIL